MSMLMSNYEYNDFSFLIRDSCQEVFLINNNNNAEPDCFYYY